jgi:hypothetical protein
MRQYKKGYGAAPLRQTVPVLRRSNQMAEQHSTIIEFPRGKYDPRKDEAEYLYPRFRARLRELVVLFGIGSVVTLAVFFLALWLLPSETFTPFPFPRFPGVF